MYTYLCSREQVQLHVSQHQVQPRPVAGGVVLQADVASGRPARRGRGRGRGGGDQWGLMGPRGRTDKHTNKQKKQSHNCTVLDIAKHC